MGYFYAPVTPIKEIEEGRERPREKLVDIEGIGLAKVAQIKAVQALAEEYLKE
jgi:DNA repair protein RadC